MTAILRLEHDFPWLIEAESDDAVDAVDYNVSIRRLDPSSRTMAGIAEMLKQSLTPAMGLDYPFIFAFRFQTCYNRSIPMQQTGLPGHREVGSAVKTPLAVTAAELPGSTGV